MSWNQSQNTNQAKRVKAANKSVLSRYWFVFALIAASLIVGGYLFVSNSDESIEDASKAPKMLPKAVVPELASTESTQVKVEPSIQKAKTPKEDWQESFVKDPQKRLAYSVRVSCETNSLGIVTERFRMPNGKFWRRVTDPPPIFDNASDNAIAMVVGGAAGAPIPPVPGLDDANLNEEFVKSLLSPIKINESDSPGIAALKMAVQNARKDIQQMIRDGDTRSVGEILQDYINDNNHTAEVQGDALKAIEDVRREMGEEAAEEYLMKVNENLKSYGISPIEFGPARSRKNSK